MPVPRARELEAPHAGGGRDPRRHSGRTSPSCSSFREHHAWSNRSSPSSFATEIWSMPPWRLTSSRMP